MSCENVYHIELPACTSNILLAAGLTASTEYCIQITDKFKNKYGKKYTANEDGEIDIDISDTDIYPEGLFNPYAGNFLLKVTEDDCCTPVELTFCEVQYTAATFTFYNTTEEDPEAKIQCCDDESV